MSSSALLVENGVADAARGAALARLAAGRPGAALALGNEPEAVLAQGRIARLLLDLLGADRRRRLAAQVDLLEDGALLAAAVAGGASNSANESAPASRRRGGALPRRRPAPGAPVRPNAAPRSAPCWGCGATSRATWQWPRAAAGASCASTSCSTSWPRPVPSSTPADVARFLGRIEIVSRAIDAYANPELALDALLFEWPRTRVAGVTDADVLPQRLEATVRGIVQGVGFRWFVVRSGDGARTERLGGQRA